MIPLNSANGFIESLSMPGVCLQSFRLVGKSVFFVVIAQGHRQETCTWLTYINRAKHNRLGIAARPFNYSLLATLGIWRES